MAKYHCIIELAQYDESLATAMCSTTECTMSAFRLINALCVGCVQNMRVLHDLLTELFYSGNVHIYDMSDVLDQANKGVQYCFETSLHHISVYVYVYVYGISYKIFTLVDYIYIIQIVIHVSSEL